MKLAGLVIELCWRDEAANITVSCEREPPRGEMLFNKGYNHHIFDCRFWQNWNKCKLNGYGRNIDGPNKPSY